MSPRRSVLVYVQHVLGVGHLNRAATLARGLSAAGWRVMLVTGGRPVPALTLSTPDRPLRVVQLPPVASADLSFSGLVDDAGQPVGAALWQARRESLMAAVAAWAPSILVVEMYPFGRSAFAAEIDGLIACVRATRPGAAVVCSVRDILVHKRRPESTARMLATANALFDMILVHGDSGLCPFAATFPHADSLRPPLVHTGYIVEREAVGGGVDDANGPGTGEVIVSGGGGAMAADLLTAAVQARPLSGAGSAVPWRVLVGRNLGADGCDRVQALAAPGVTVEWARPDFRSLLGRARLSVSQAGYNTVVETLAARCPAVLVPWGEGTESEQRTRAQALERAGLALRLPADQLGPAALGAAVHAGLTRWPSRIDGVGISLDGVARSVDALSGLLCSRDRPCLKDTPG